LLRKDEAREPIALRILLPVHEVISGRHLERIAQDRRARMRRRTQADGLRAEVDRSVVFVVRDVMQCDEDRHGKGHSSSFFEQNTAESLDQALTTGMECLGGGLGPPPTVASPNHPWLIRGLPPAGCPFVWQRSSTAILKARTNRRPRS